jgi:hypothetical protein
MVRRFAWDVGVFSARKIEPLHEPLLGEQFKVAKDRGAPDPKAASIGIKEQLGGGEVPLSPPDQFCEFSAWARKAYPRLIQRREHLVCHNDTLSQMRLSLITNTTWPILVAAILRRWD